MENQLLIQSRMPEEDLQPSTATLWINLAISILLGLLGLGVIQAESFTTLTCQREGAGYCEMTGIGIFKQNATQRIYLNQITDVSYESPAESESFNLLITQSGGDIRLKGFSAEQAQAIQSFIDNPSQPNLSLQQPYDRRPYAMAIGGLFVLIGASGAWNGLRRITSIQ